jgi:hypothetical protein
MALQILQIDVTFPKGRSFPGRGQAKRAEGNLPMWGKMQKFASARPQLSGDCRTEGQCEEWVISSLDIRVNLMKFGLGTSPWPV